MDWKFVGNSESYTCNWECNFKVWYFTPSRIWIYFLNDILLRPEFFLILVVLKWNKEEHVTGVDSNKTDFLGTIPSFSSTFTWLLFSSWISNFQLWMAVIREVVHNYKTSFAVLLKSCAIFRVRSTHQIKLFLLMLITNWVILYILDRFNHAS